MRDGALYYPYIHIRDLNWLKGNLLLFDDVARMVPMHGPVPNDDPEIEPFTRPQATRGPLLRPANLWSPRSVKAQETLAGRLRADAQDLSFRSNFGRAATEAAKAPKEFGFQIHQGKLEYSLRSALRDTGLAWEPGNPEPYDLDKEYVELHPRVGEAVMSTLAVACAIGEGLGIVTHPDEGPLHRCLLERKQDEVYDAWLGRSAMPEPEGAEGRELLQFLVTFACDTSRLGAGALADFERDRTALKALLQAADERASEIIMDQGEHREEAMKAAVADLLAAWRRERANMSSFWRRFFGEGLLDTAIEFLRDMFTRRTAAATAACSAAGAVASGGAAAASIGVVASATVVGAGAGLAVGLVAHAATTAFRAKQAESESAYRYLTALEKGHVTFVTDFHAGRRWKEPAPSPAVPA